MNALKLIHTNIEYIEEWRKQVISELYRKWNWISIILYGIATKQEINRPQPTATRFNRIISITIKTLYTWSNQLLGLFTLSKIDFD